MVHGVTNALKSNTAKIQLQETKFYQTSLFHFPKRTPFGFALSDIAVIFRQGNTLILPYRFWRAMNCGFVDEAIWLPQT